MNALMAYAFTAAIFAALALSAFYTAARLRALLGLSRRWPILLALGTVLAGAIVTTIVAPRSASPTVGDLYVAFGYGFYFHVYLCLALLCAHLVQKLTPVHVRWAGSVAVVAALGASVAGAVHAERFSVVETRIPIAGLPRELRVLQISDLHLGHHRGREYLTSIVAATNRATPDLIVITGDMMDSNAALQPGVLAPLSAFAAPVFYVMGNHEETIDTDRALRQLATHGVHILHNQVVETHGVQLVGLDYMNADEQAFNMHPSRKKATIWSALQDMGLRRDRPTIVLHHSPEGVRYAEAKGADLFLAGHTHGGQIFPFNLMTPLLFPIGTGLHQEGRTKVFVSPGAGTFLLRARLGTSNEIDLLRLVPAR